MTTESDAAMDANLEAMLSQGIPGQGTPGDAGADGTPTGGQPSPEGGKAADAAPATGQAGDDATGKGEEAGTAPEEGKPTGPSEADIKAALSLASSPEQTADSLKRDLQASSTEARRLNEEIKARNELLKEQGLKWQKDSDGKWQLTGKPKDGQKAPQKFEELSHAEAREFEAILADAAENDAPPSVIASKLFDFVASKVGQNTLSVAPTAEKVVERISDERMDIAFQSVIDKFKDRYPGLNAGGDGNGTQTKEYMKFMLQDAPQGVREAFYKHPEAQGALFAARIQAETEALSRLAQHTAKEQQKKEAAAREAADMSGGAGGGSPMLGGGNSEVSQKAAEFIANSDR